MSVETYESIIDIDNSIEDSEAENNVGGELLDAKLALKALREKHFS